MRHRKKKIIQLSTGVQKRSNVVRNLLTSLVVHGQVVTTEKRAKVLKATADKFFSRLMRSYQLYTNEADATRENIRFVKATIYGEGAGKKVMNERLPKYKSAGNGSFVADYKIWYRPGDASMKTMLKLL